MGLEQDATISASGANGSSGGGDDEDLAPGTQVGEYVVDSKLGEGGFGSVYRATHPVIGKTAAVKVLHRAFSSQGEMVSRFVAEARAVNQIRHRHIIDIFAFGQLPDGRHYYVMELLEGLPFDKHLEHVERMDLASALPIFRAVAKALDAAHAAGIVHRDLKPENIFLVAQDDGTFFPKLLDFGIAKLLTDPKEAPKSGHKTRTGIQIGTPYYMSPEQCRGVGVDHRTDVYAFGVMIHRVLTGRLPFEADSMMDIMMAHLSTAPPKLSQFGFPAPLDEPLLRMLAKDPAQRPQTMVAAVDALENAARAAGWDLGKLPPKAPGAPIETNVGKVVTDLSMATSEAHPRGKAWIWAVAALAAVAVIGGGVVLATSKEHDKGATTATSTTTVAPLPTTSTSATATTTASATTTVTATASAPTISSANVKFDAKPKDAEIWFGDIHLGNAPGPVPVPVTPGGLDIMVKAPGYTPKTIRVVPKEGATVPVTLSKASAAGPTAKSLSKDLENPF